MKPIKPKPPKRISDAELAKLPRNDRGNAKRLIHRFGADLMWVDGFGWFYWNGAFWSREKGDQMSKLLAQKTAKAVEAEAAALDAMPKKIGKTYRPRGEQDNRHWKWARQCGDRARLDAMLKVAAPRLNVDGEEIDSDLWLFNVKNGTLNLHATNDPGADGSIRLMPHARAYRITRLSPVNYDPTAEAPHWRKFLDEILPDREVQTFLQTWIGYGLTGEVSEQCLFILYGHGANGKSTFLEVIARMFGTYAATLPFASIVYSDYRRGSEATPDLARLPAVRFAAASEPEVGVRLSESLIKQMTGGDRMVVRQLNQPFIEFVPQFKLNLSVNNRPQIRGQDEGIWRRIRMIPFSIIIPPNSRDRRLVSKLWAERSGILNWALDGLRIWRERGLVIPASVQAATDDYRSENDTVGQFLAAVTVEKRGERVSAKILYIAYRIWCNANALSPLGMNAFGRVMTERGQRREKIGINYYLGREIHDADLLAQAQGGLDTGAPDE